MKNNKIGCGYTKLETQKKCLSKMKKHRDVKNKKFERVVQDCSYLQYC